MPAVKIMNDKQRVHFYKKHLLMFLKRECMSGQCTSYKFSKQHTNKLTPYFHVFFSLLQLKHSALASLWCIFSNSRNFSHCTFFFSFNVFFFFLLFSLSSKTLLSFFCLFFPHCCHVSLSLSNSLYLLLDNP